MFGHDWRGGAATIVAVRVKKTSGDGLVSIHEYVADVRVDGAEPFRTILEEPGIATNFWSPEVGQIVRVKADVARQKAKFDKHDPSLNAKTRGAAADAAFDAAAGGAPG